ncbi:MAG TPA: vanadium-dependent haloperoxidase, partial [Blastocatellia bacterium]|nr:vanadium-dependent haloperoxidase [Blastocatellia bacterium]
VGGGAVLLGVPAFIPATKASINDDISPEATATQRAEKAYQLRVNAALVQKNLPLPTVQTNGDESRYPNKIGNFSKGLPHNQLGEVDLNAYQALVFAATNGKPEDFERIQLDQGRPLTNPQAGLAFGMIGPDTHHITQPPAPAFSSAEIAAEIAENYWMALTRDVNFLDYDSHPLTNAAAADLSRFSDFRGPKLAGRAARTSNLSEAASEADERGTRTTRAKAVSRFAQPVTTATLFRGNTTGDLVGPYISQFLWKDAPFGAQTISGKMRTPIAGDDYMTSYDDWLAVQRGANRGLNRIDPTPRYIRNGRDLSEWVHIDVLYQGYFNAMLLLMAMGAPVDENNPYNKSRNQISFGTFGPPHIASLMPGVAAGALQAVWYQKWIVHRRLRPEVFAGRVHNHLTKAANYPIHPDILNSRAVQAVAQKHGTHLLPMAFPEGSPTHPAYGAGHATVAGACVTILKAWFDESWVLPDPVVVSPDGLSLVKYVGPDLTVGNELNKLASNVGVGRNIAGVHWRSDYWESVKFGEAYAIGVLTDIKGCYNEYFDGFSLTKFDGTKITI